MSTLPVAQTFSLQDLVSYQEGAVVSRQIVRSARCNVTLFAFDAAQELSEHASPFDALVHVLEGELEVRISDQPYRMQDGMILVIPANHPHAVRALSRVKMLLTMIRD